MSQGAPAAARFDLVRFVRHPEPRLDPVDGSRVRTFVRLWLACLGTVLVTAPLSYLGSAVSGVSNRIDDVPQGTLIVLAVVIAPLIEETTFRLVLARFQARYLIIAAAAAAFLLAPWGLLVLAVVLVAVAVPGSRRWLEVQWASHFLALFWTSALLFGLLHGSNWNFDDAGWWTVALLPLLVLPQAGLGLVLGAARVRLGLAGSMLLHAAYNGTILAVTLLGS